MIAALPLPVGWKLIPIAEPIADAPKYSSSLTFSIQVTGRGEVFYNLAITPP